MSHFFCYENVWIGKLVCIGILIGKIRGNVSLNKLQGKCNKNITLLILISCGIM